MKYLFTFANITHIALNVWYVLFDVGDHLSSCASPFIPRESKLTARGEARVKCVQRGTFCGRHYDLFALITDVK